MKKINGNIDGIKDYVLNELAKVYDVKFEKYILFTEDVAEFIAKISNDMNREINISIDRNGNVIEIAIGDSSTVNLPILETKEKRLSGVRIIHTHPGGNPHLSSVDISALIKLKLDCIVSIGVTDKGITGYEIAFCDLVNNVLRYESFFTHKIENFEFYDKVIEIERNLRKNSNGQLVEDDKEYAILVGIGSEETLNELEELAFACNIEVVAKFIQNKKNIDPAFFIGTGKVRELALKVQIEQANLIIVDDELSGIQIKNLELVTGCKTIDRTTLILEIFARRARSKEAKIQVELAQLKYRSQRLIGFGISMSRLGGGVGTKGPGEKKLEIDRRRIRENITFLTRELEEIKKHRNNQRAKREESGISKVSLVGYTNVGKSTLRNLIANIYAVENIKKEEVFVENMLFATLDTTTRSIMLQDKRVISLTDTVGFIRKLPHDLVEAFKSTLEEVIFSDLILHVVDASSEDAISQIYAVEKVLKELNALDKNMILVLNKCDIATEEQKSKIKEEFTQYKTVEISAKNNINIDILMNMISDNLEVENFECTFLIPYNNTDISAMLHRNAIVLKENYAENGILIDAIVNKKDYNICKKFLVNG